MKPFPSNLPFHSIRNYISNFRKFNIAGKNICFSELLSIWRLPESRINFGNLAWILKIQNDEFEMAEWLNILQDLFKSTFAALASLLSSSLFNNLGVVHEMWQIEISIAKNIYVIMSIYTFLSADPSGLQHIRFLLYSKNLLKKKPENFSSVTFLEYSSNLDKFLLDLIGISINLAEILRNLGQH